MKSILSSCLILICLNIAAQTSISNKIQADIYLLLIPNDTIPGKINSKDITKLNEPLTALAAFYSGFGGSGCKNNFCEITSALGLGKQGSEKQKNLIKKWMPNDKLAAQLINQNCFQPNDGASKFSDYQYLCFEVVDNIVIVNYALIIYNKGETTMINGPDKYQIIWNEIQVINRNLK